MRFLFMVSVLIILSCSEDESTQVPIDPPSTPINPIIIINEGSFSNPTASISTYNQESYEVENLKFQSINDEPLGTVLQNLIVVDESYYAVMNVTGEIVQMNKTDFLLENRISGFESPRYMEIHNNNAYITDLSKDVIYRVSLNDFSINEIALPGWTEDMIILDDILLIGGRTTSYLYLLDLKSNQLIDTIEVGFGPTEIRIDVNGDVWVYCAGESFYAPMIAPTIYKVDVDRRSSEKMITVTSAGTSSKLAFNPSLDTVYYTSNDIYRFSINDPSRIELFFSRPSASWYGLGVSNEGEIYASDAIDFVQSGLVYRISISGTAIDSFFVGVNPNGFLFE